MQLNVSAWDELYGRILSRLTATMETSTSQPPPEIQPNVWRIMLHSHLLKTAAAVVVIAVGIGLFQLDRSGVAWAEVLSAMEAIPTVVFEMRNVSSLGENTILTAVSKVYDAGAYGSRVDIRINDELLLQKYALQSEKIAYRIRPKERMYSSFAFLPDQKPAEGDFPRQWVATLLSEDYTRLGTDTIDGIAVEGIEVNNSTLLKGDEGVVRLWVDVKTNLPVLIELKKWMLEDDVETSLDFVIDHFEWNVELSEDVFIPEILEDYALIEEQYRLPDEMKSADVFPYDDFNYNEIVPGSYFSVFTLDMAVDEVMDIMGEPKNYFYSEETYTAQTLPNTYYMCYENICFFINDGFVKEITATSSFYKIVCHDSVSYMLLDDVYVEITALSPFYDFADDGLRVGNSEQKVIELLGDDYQLKETPWKDFMAYENLGITFEIHKTDRTVMEINFGFNK